MTCWLGHGIGWEEMYIYLADVSSFETSRFLFFLHEKVGNSAWRVGNIRESMIDDTILLEQPEAYAWIDKWGQGVFQIPQDSWLGP